MQASLRSLRKLGCALPVSKDGRPRSGLMVRDASRSQACAGCVNRVATLLTTRGQPVRQELLRRKEAGRRTKQCARSLFQSRYGRLGSRRPVAAPYASKNRTERSGERQRCWLHS